MNMFFASFMFIGLFVFILEQGPDFAKAVVDSLFQIGAGGGSIASIDGVGLLKVGPRSAGAAPGPACYGRGGDKPTVTDANLGADTAEESADILTFQGELFAVEESSIGVA